MQRLIHIAGSLGIVLVTYWAYALVAVPLIEPEEKATAIKPPPNGDPDSVL